MYGIVTKHILCEGRTFFTVPDVWVSLAFVTDVETTTSERAERTVHVR